jgi:hypothetical protein
MEKRMDNTRIQAPRERPVGVTIIAVLLGIEGIFEIILGILALTNIFPQGLISSGNSPVGGYLGATYLLAGLIKLLLIWGLLRLKRWAWVATILFAGLSIVTSCFAISQSHFVLWTLLFDMVIPAVIWIYFILNDDLRSAFRA